MLLEAIELQNRATEELVQKLETKKELTFRAPTGSGKTHMMADFMTQILSSHDDVVFLVSTLSKGDLAKQNYDKFLSYVQDGDFPKLNPYLINTEISGEERLYIPSTYNVYLLPRDLYKKNGKLMEGVMESFLNTMTLPDYLGGLSKRIILIKDECHIATNNLDSISDAFFERIINFSATPNLKRGQNPDVEITDDDAVAAKLIKHIELGPDEETVEDAINKFEKIKEDYRNLLGVNPCLIIQISNKDKADYEINNVIMPILNKAEHQDLKWMLIVDKDQDCNTNDVFKAKKMPVKKWKDYAKSNTSTIDIIIFKMVISEGWDIPRACMLYQIRDTQSDQLDEQVMGRVRRNPRLLDFEFLSEEAKELALTAWIWGTMPHDKKKIFNVKLYEKQEDIQNEFLLHTTRLKDLTKKKDFNLSDFINGQPDEPSYQSIFSLYRKLEKQDSHIKQMCYEYSNSFEAWRKFTENVDSIAQESSKFICDYEESMELEKDDSGNPVTKTLSTSSSYVDNGNYINISDWVWKRNDGKDKFSFDSDAEREWASILKDLCSIDSSCGSRAIKKIRTGKPNPEAGVVDLFGTIQPDMIDEADRFMWGKNYVSGSNIKFEYYLNGVHDSFPDFIMKDSFNRIHLFEVKSVNISSGLPSSFDKEAYKKKVEELKKSYKQASKLTGYIFYLPVLKDDSWFITQLINGEERNLTKAQFVDFVKNN